MRRWLALAAAAVALAAGIFLFLLAVDVHRWQSRLAADDIAFRTAETRHDLWQPSQLLPGDLARSLLGVDDDLRTRHALQIFRLGRERVPFFVASSQMIAYRSEAQALLSRAADSDRERPRRAQELNLLGILELIAVGGGDPAERQKYLPRAADDFRQAIALDPTNADAKFNLELTLRLLQNASQSGGARSGLGGVTARGEESGSGY
jgi:hypothetical protein